MRPLNATRVGHVHLDAVHGHRHAAECLKVQAGCGHDDVGLEFAPGFELDAAFGEGVDPVGDHRGVPVADGLEQVAIGNDAQPLIPRVVGGLEVLIDGITLGQLPGIEVADHLLGGARDSACTTGRSRAAE